MTCYIEDGNGELTWSFSIGVFCYGYLLSRGELIGGGEREGPQRRRVYSTCKTFTGTIRNRTSCIGVVHFLHELQHTLRRKCHVILKNTTYHVRRDIPSERAIRSGANAASTRSLRRDPVR